MHLGTTPSTDDEVFSPQETFPPTSAPPAPAMKTRAALKQELLSTLPHGDESSFLSNAQLQLQNTRNQLQSLREERSKINREIAVRRRKLQEWKEKVPRGMGSIPCVGDMTRELERCGQATCRCVAQVEILGKMRRRLRFGKAYRKGLEGVEGFEKVWVLVKVPDGMRMLDGKLWTGIQEIGLYLCLVHVESVLHREGVVEVRGMEVEGDMNKVGDIVVLDLKPYLPYCDAWAQGHKEASCENDLSTG